MKKTNDQQEIFLENNLTIQSAKKIREQVLDALVKSKTIFLKFGIIQKVDLSFFQIICAAHKTCFREHKILKISGPVPEIIRLASQNLGFKELAACTLENRTCIW